MREADPMRTTFNADIAKVGRGDLTHLLSYGASVGMERALSEYAARLCYNSVGKMGTSPNFITKILATGHLSVVEHASIAMPIDTLLQPVKDLKVARGSPKSQTRNARVQEIIRLYRYNRFFSNFPGFVAGNLRSWFEVLGKMQYNPLMEVFLSVLPEAFENAPVFSEVEISHVLDSQPVMVPSYFGAEQGRHNCVLLAVNPGSYGRIKGSAPRGDGWHHWARYTFLIENVSRNLTHQLVRHRGGSFSQESQRYVDSRNVGFVFPPNVDYTQEAKMRQHFQESVSLYEQLRDDGVKKEDARFVLPGATATRLIASFDLKELLHFLKVRCAKDAQWEIRRLARTMALQASLAVPFEQLNKLVQEFEIYELDDGK